MALDPSSLIGADRYLAFQQDRLARIGMVRQNQVSAQQLQARWAPRFAQQQMQRYQAPPEQQGFDPSGIPVIGGLLGAGGTALSGALDALGRPAQAVAGAALALQAGTNPLEGAAQAFTESADLRKDLNFATFLERAGVENEWVRNIAGFGMGAVLDPTNLLALGPVRQVVGGLVRGAGAIAAGATGASRLGSPVERMVFWAKNTLEYTFDPPFLGEATRAQISRSLRQRGRDTEATGKLWEDARQLSSFKRVGDRLVARELYEGVRDELQVANVERLNMTPDAAKKAAESFLDDLANDPSVKQATFKWLDQASYAGQTPDELAKNAVNANHLALARWWKTNYARDGGIYTNLKKLAYGADFAPMEAVFLKRFMDPRAKTLQAARATGAGLQKKFGTATIKRQGVDPQTAENVYDVETDVLAAVGYDMATTRLNAIANTAVDDASLRGLAGRKLTMAGDPFQVRAELRTAGVDIDVVTDAAQQEFYSPAAADALATRAGISPFQVRDPKLNARVREYLDNIAWRDEAAYDRAPSRLVMTEDDAKNAAAALGDDAESSFYKVYDRWMLPKPVASALTTMSNSRKMLNWLQPIDTFNSYWKPLVTVMWPGFHIRNTGGLVTLMSESGMHPGEIAAWTNSAVRVMSRREGGVVKRSAEGVLSVEIPNATGVVSRIPITELEREAALRNVIGPGRTAEGASVTAIQGASGPATIGGQVVPKGIKGTIARVQAKWRGDEVKPLQGLEKMKSLIAQQGESLTESLGRNPMAYMRAFGEGQDNAAKLAMYMWRLSKGDNLDVAAEFSRKWGMAYVEAGRAIDVGAATALPFIRWLRFNLPRQVETVMSRPYVPSKLTLAQGSSLTNRDLADEAEVLPDWVLEGFNVVLGKNEDGSLRVISGLGLPIEDLNRLFFLNPTRTAASWISDLSPVLKMPIEAAADHSFFTGEPIDDPSFKNYFARVGVMTANTPILKDWLGVEEVKDPRTGRIRYLVKEPMHNYLFASLFGRLQRTGDNIADMIVQPREEGGNAFSILTGVRQSDVFQPVGEDVPFAKQLAQDPYLNDAYNAYQEMALYPQFGDAGLSRTAARAYGQIKSEARYAQRSQPQLTDEQAFEIALQVHADRDPQGVVLVRTIRRMGWKPEGAKARQQFLDINPDLGGLINGLDPSTREGIQGFLGV